MQSILLMDSVVPTVQPAAVPSVDGAEDECGFVEEMARQEAPAEEIPEEDAEGAFCVQPLPLLLSDKPVAVSASAPETTEADAARAKTEALESQIAGRQVSPEPIANPDPIFAVDVSVIVLSPDTQSGEVLETPPPSPAQRLVEAQMNETGADLSQKMPEIAPTEGQSTQSDGSNEQSKGEAMPGQEPAGSLLDDISASGDGKPHPFHLHMPVEASASPDRAQAPMTIAPETVIHVAEQIINNNDDRLDISLTPEELGRLRLTLTEDNGKLMVTMAADRPETLDLMRRNADSLAQELRTAGYSAVEFSFADQRDQQRDQPEKSKPSAPAVGTAAHTTQTPDYQHRQLSVSDGINLLL